MPLAVAFRGIDRYCERYYAKGPRRRPVRVEFCEADILDAFDDWRRAVGVGGATRTAAGGGGRGPTRRRCGRGAGRPQAGLPAHLDRAIARLAIPGGRPAEGEWHRRLDETVRDLEALLATAKQARGEARAAIVSRLAALDAELLDAAEGHVEAGLAGRCAPKRPRRSRLSPRA